MYQLLLGGYKKMDKIYYYRKHIRNFNKLIPIILFSLSGLLFILSIIMIALAQIESFVVLIIMTFIIGGEAFLMKFLFSRLASTMVKLDHEGIHFENKKETIFINYEDIEKVENPSIKYLGGWIKIVSPSKTIRLTVVLESIHEFIIDLKQQLDDRDLSDVYNEKKLFNFFKTAAYSDMSWVRFYRLFFKLLMFQISAAIIPIIIIILTDNLTNTLAYLIMIISIFIPTIAYLISEIFLVIGMRQNIKQKGFSIIHNDTEYENKVYKGAIIIGTILYVFLSLLLIIL